MRFVNYFKMKQARQISANI